MASLSLFHIHEPRKEMGYVPLRSAYSIFGNDAHLAIQFIHVYRPWCLRWYQNCTDREELRKDLEKQMKRAEASDMLALARVVWRL